MDIRFATTKLPLGTGYVFPKTFCLIQRGIRERTSLSKETYIVKHPLKYSHLVTFSGVLTYAWGCRGEWFRRIKPKPFTLTTPRIRKHP